MMKHKHVGPPDVACTGCFGEAQSNLDSEERWKTVGGIVLLIALVIGGMLALSWYLSKHGSHLG